MATKKEMAKEVKRVLDQLYPETHCFLNYQTDWQLLFAVILSAQATDESVNAATSILFAKFDSLEKYTDENLEEIKRIIKPVGLGNSKSTYLVKTAKILLEEENGLVPRNREKLVKLPGVGFKTSGVVLAELYDFPYIPVDTHVGRVTKRIGLVKSDLSPEATEITLEKLFLGIDCINTHRQLILLGRNICDSRKPKCGECPLASLCKYKKKK